MAQFWDDECLILVGLVIGTQGHVWMNQPFLQIEEVLVTIGKCTM